MAICARVSFQYDLMDNAVRSIDRNGRVVEYDYDHLYRLIEERWRGPSESVDNTIRMEFDEANQLLRLEDVAANSRLAFSYDRLGRVTQTDVDNGGPNVVFRVRLRCPEQSR